jgi:1-acyl-sn-glycerol-3-phosphate acyltransferase
MDFDALLSLSTPQVRDVVPQFLAGYFSDQDPGLVEATRAGAEQVLRDASDDAIAHALTVYGEAGRDWRIYEADPVLRALSRDWMPRCMPTASVIGVENLPQDTRGCLFVCNHLSYVDTQVTDSLLAVAGAHCRDDVLVVAGPKVYTEPFRRVAATALNTLMTPQSGRLAHNANDMTQREVAVLAVQCMQLARAWMTERGPLLLYPEGSRSRSGRLGPFLRAAARYARGARLVVPLAITGSEQLFAYDERMRVAEVTLRIGQPFVPGAGKTAALEEAWARIGELLPDEYAPQPGTAVLR